MTLRFQFTFKYSKNLLTPARFIYTIYLNRKENKINMRIPTYHANANEVKLLLLK
jgi:hypothetical protein